MAKGRGLKSSEKALPDRRVLRLLPGRLSLFLVSSGVLLLALILYTYSPREWMSVFWSGNSRERPVKAGPSYELKKWVSPNPTEPLPTSLIAIGDLHGDYLNFLRVLEMSRLVKVDWHNDTEERLVRNHPGRGPIGAMHDVVQAERNWTWIGGSSWGIQIGDVVDRGHDTILLYETIKKLRVRADEAGGKFLAILGNHEIMNFVEDLRYVTPLDYESFSSKETRRRAWYFDGSIGKELSQSWNVMEAVGDTIFVHAGISRKFFDGGSLNVNNINSELRDLFNRHHTGGAALFDPHHWLFDADGPVWYRGQALDDHKTMCKNLVTVLSANRASKLVVGHTPQTNGKVLHRVCYGENGIPIFDRKTNETYQVFVVDVGISKFYGGNVGALNISYSVTDNKKHILQKVSSIYLNSKANRLLSKEKYIA